MTVTDDTRQRTVAEGNSFVTDLELCRALRLPERVGLKKFKALDEMKVGFPPKRPFWGNRRWLPDVIKFIERTGDTLGDGADRSAAENRDHRTRLPRHHILRHGPAEGDA